MVEWTSVWAGVDVGMNGRVKGNLNKAEIAGFGGNPDEGNWQIWLDRMTAKRGFLPRRSFAFLALHFEFWTGQNLKSTVR